MNNELSVKDFLNNNYGFNDNFSIENAQKIASNIPLLNQEISANIVSSHNNIPGPLAESHLPKGVYKFDGEKLVRIGDVDESSK